MKNGFDIEDRYGRKIGSLEVREKSGLLPLLMFIGIIGVAVLSYFIWPLFYKVVLKEIATRKREEVITIFTVLGGIVLGCIGGLIWTLRVALKDGPRRTGVIVTMMTGAQGAAIGSFGTSVGITTIAFIILGITTGTFNFWEFLLLLLMLVIISALLCILPTLITAILAGLIVGVTDLVARIKHPAKPRLNRDK